MLTTRTATDLLRDHGIQPSAQRIAVAEYVLDTEDHPSADEVWQAVQDRVPMISRATVYNTLNLFVEKALLRAIALTGGHTVFDPKTDPHHHFIDEPTGRIYDVPWSALSVKDIKDLEDFDVREYQVVLRGSRRDG